MELQALIDPLAAAIVVGGTALATLLRSGAGDCRTTWKVTRHLGSEEFDEDALRSDLARMVHDLETDGIWRTEPYYFRDAASDDAARAMIKERLLPIFFERQAKHQAKRAADNLKAYTTLSIAAENAPAFGLAGTLLALSQLPSDPAQGMGGALAAAVLTTLYGVLLGHLMLTPLAEAIRRSGELEEEVREDLIKWTAWKLEGAVIKSPKIEIDPDAQTNLVGDEAPDLTNESVAA